MKRDETLATAMVVEIAGKPRWIIEGVYGWLAAAALPFATSLIWLDLPWSMCSEGLSRRGPWKERLRRRTRGLSAMGRSLLAAPDADLVLGPPGAVREFRRTETASPVREEIDALLATPLGAVPF